MKVLYVNHSCVLRINQTRLVELPKLPDIKVGIIFLSKLALLLWKLITREMCFYFMMPDTRVPAVGDSDAIHLLNTYLVPS